MHDIRIDSRARPQLGYVGSALDRAADKRGDEGFLAQRTREAGCGFYVVCGDAVVLKPAGELFDPLFAAPEVAALGAGADSIFLGLQGEAARFAVALPAPAHDGHPGLHFTDLRSLAVQGLVAPEHLAPLAEAKALLHWHARHGYCANCGAPTSLVFGGWRRDCPQCRAQHFPRTDPVVIMLAVRGDLCLLGRQSRFIKDMWSCLAGFVEPGETIEDAARRETFEEAGIRCGKVRYFASQPWPFPSSLMIGCHIQALTSEIVVDRNELEDARWVDRAEAAAMLARRHPAGLITPAPFAIAHHIIRAWVETGDDVLA